MELTVDSTLQELGFAIHLAAIRYPVKVAESPSGLIESIQAEGENRQQELMGEAVSSDPVIAAVRRAFKLCGKDPSRYRPSSEALLRRIMAGKGLYSINNVVDAGNLLSLGTGIPVGCYDTRKISGNITLRLGTAEERYEGVTRADVNLENMPLLADDLGPFGTPYSDSARTSVDETTTDFLLVLFGFNVTVEVVEQVAEAADLIFAQYCVPEAFLQEAERQEETVNDQGNTNDL